MNIWTFTMEFVAFFFWLATFTQSERVALIAAFLVLVGVAGEYVIELPAIEERERLRARIKQLSMALLLLGLTGDVLGIVMGQAEMAALTKEAADAAVSAKTAREEADAVKITASQARAWVLHRRPRYTSFDAKKFIASLRGLPPQGVEILYKSGSEEGYTLGFAIAIALARNGNAGWKVVGPRPVTEKDAILSSNFHSPSENVPLIMRAGGSGGCGVISNPATDASGIGEALANSGAFGELDGSTSSTLPLGTVRIVIGEQSN